MTSIDYVCPEIPKDDACKDDPAQGGKDDPAQGGKDDPTQSKQVCPGK